MIHEVSERYARNLPVTRTALYITSPFCQTCIFAERMVEEAIAEEGRTEVVKLNLQLAPDFAMDYRIRSVPTLLLFENGKLVDRLAPLKHPANILYFLRLNNKADHERGIQR